ncbi:MAG TPA: type II secretion system F family protein [Pirellulales bacterium]|nr:type II secretion system F family protein [Pirellulales bacterium]
MIFSARIGQKDLAQLCRRLATGLTSGVDARQVWSREAAGYASASYRRRLDLVSDAINHGSTVSDALLETGDYFPTLFRELINVGEHTGKLAEVCRHLAEHYEHQIRLRRQFVAAIAWPVVQLSAALCVIGLVILIMGLLPPGENGKPTDILGLGLIGVSGFTIYLFVLGMAAVCLWLTIQAVRRGALWVRPLQYVLMKVPVLGPSLQTLSLAKLAWSMQLTLETEMSVLKSLPLSLRSTRNAFYTDHSDEIVQAIRAGSDISSAMADTKAFPREFLDSLAVGEHSGRLPETMALLSTEYQDRAQRALATLTMLAGFGVWVLVAVMIIVMIFRVALQYINMISNAANGIF